MAKKDIDLSFLNTALNRGTAQRIQDDLDNAYKKTYYSDNRDAKYIDSIRRIMDRDLNGLIDRTRLRNSGNSISDLYSRTLANNDEDLVREFKQALSDESMLSDLMDMYSQNAVQRDLDREIDVVCKYVPKLEEALDIKADHVMCADHFNQDNMEITRLTNAGGKEVDQNDGSGMGSADTARADIDSFKKKYLLRELADKCYRKTAKYGEQFVYVVSYNKALKRLVRRTGNQGLMIESAVLNEETISQELQCDSFSAFYGNVDEKKGLTESVYFQETATPSFLPTDPILESYDQIQVEINTTGVIPTAFAEAQTKRRVIMESSILFDDSEPVEQPINEAIDGIASSGKMLSNNSYLRNMKQEFKKFAKGGTMKSPTRLAVDGFVDQKGAKKRVEEELNIPGCIVKLLDHTMVKILKIDETILGYYYIECNRDMDNNQTTFSSTLGGLRPRRSTRDRDNMERPSMDDQVLMKISRAIAQKIDTKFINANQDLAEEIYAILKYNADHGDGKVSRIRVSFIPPDDIVHVYFDINEKTHRGISDLSKSLFPAKLLSCLYISNTIALLTRGYDKRIYQVRQTVDTNIQAVLLSVINQIKQSNFNLRQIENMNNILNITGRFNDLVIPQNQNGESPVNFEVMPGQNIEIKSEFMQMLEEMAVNLTGVSLEMVNSRYQEQTATHITMSNSRFLIKIYDRQIKYQDFLSEIFTRIYQCEYGVEDELEVRLPAPVMLNFTNTSQILSVANELINNIVLMKMGAQQTDELLKNEFVSGLMNHFFKSFLPVEKINQIFDDARVELATKKEKLAMAQQGAMGGGIGGSQPGY